MDSSLTISGMGARREIALSLRVVHVAHKAREIVQKKGDTHITRPHLYAALYFTPSLSRSILDSLLLENGNQAIFQDIVNWQIEPSELQPKDRVDETLILEIVKRALVIAVKLNHKQLNTAHFLAASITLKQNHPTPKIVELLEKLGVTSEGVLRSLSEVIEAVNVDKPAGSEDITVVELEL